MAPAENYLLRVTAGPSYDPSTHAVVPVNSEQPFQIDNEHMTTHLTVRILNYRGFPEGSPTTTSYFSHEAHTKDRYSISFSFLPKKNVSGNDILFGNDFDRPIRDRLPPGFNTAFKIAKWAIDPGLDGDPYADKPYLYGPALSSINTWRVGEKLVDKDEMNGGWKLPGAVHEDVILEGADGSGEELRRTAGMPSEADKRKKWALNEQNRLNFAFEQGRLYQGDFFNPYLDFNDFSLKLPGFSLSVIKYIDEKSHTLRYVLKHRQTTDVYFVVVFTLLFGEELSQAKSEAPRSKENSLNRIDEKGALSNSIFKSQKAGSQYVPQETDLD
ncbi:MAG: hypothetical protein M1834_006320 [Cirrosporium novae-zelandiae]|nr:MAG: hypothetical protein M1834_006320 [Cirrosporium novae-zelandiae]